MSYGYILFWDRGEKPLTLTQKEYEGVMKVWETATEIIIQGNIIHKSDIRRVKPPEKIKQFSLPERSENPVKKETIKRITAEIAKKFPIKNP